MGDGRTAAGAGIGVVELRVHGVSGTKPEAMLDDPFPRQVSGDESARIFRRSDRLVSRLDGRSRTVEGLHWGRFTSGSASKVLWLLLAPMAILNLARYAMLLPHTADRVRPADRLATGCLRLLGLGLTLLLVATAAYLGWGLGLSFPWYAGVSGGYRVLLGAVAPAAVLAMLWWFGRQTFVYDPAGGRVEWRTPYGSFDDVGFWSGSPATDALRAGHVLAALGAVALLATTLAPASVDWSSSLAGWSLQWAVAIGMLSAIAGVVVVLTPLTFAATLTPAVRRWLGLLALSGTAAGVFYAAWASSTSAPEPQRVEQSLTWIAVALSLLLLPQAVLCLLQTRGAAGRLLREGHRDDPAYPRVPGAFRPFWRGYGSFFLAVIAVSFALGLTGVLVLWWSTALGASGQPEILRLSAAVWGVGVLMVVAFGVPLLARALERPVALWTWLAGIALAATLLAADELGVFEPRDLLYGAAVVLLGVALKALVDPDRGFEPQLRDDYPSLDGETGAPASDRSRGRAAVLRRWSIAQSRTVYHRALGWLTGLAVLLLLLISAVSLEPGLVDDGRASSAMDALVPLGNAALSAITAGLVLVGVSAFRDPEKRRAVGIVWDLLSFWPRDAHPLCPPPYGGRAVLATATRATQLAADDLPGMGASAVVLSGHSQGSLICAASVAVLDFLAAPTEADVPRPTGPWLTQVRCQHAMSRLGLITYGSQLQFLYARLFPTYFGYGRVSWIRRRALGDGRWRSLYRWTDPLGAPVLSWPVERRERPGPRTSSWTGLHWPDCDSAAPMDHAAVPRWRDDPSTVGAAPADRVTYRWYEIGDDVRLVDPGVIVESPYAPRLGPLGHSDYPRDPVFDHVVDRIAATLGESRPAPDA